MNDKEIETSVRETSHPSAAFGVLPNGDGAHNLGTCPYRELNKWPLNHWATAARLSKCSLTYLSARDSEYSIFLKFHIVFEISWEAARAEWDFAFADSLRSTGGRAPWVGLTDDFKSPWCGASSSVPVSFVENDWLNTKNDWIKYNFKCFHKLSFMDRKHVLINIH